jgi:alkylation response protein AidB-like acyl-CoA dehydrogenase
VDFQLDEDQLALREGLRSFCDGRVPADALPELEKAGGIDRELWGELAEMGVFSLRLAEDAGGVGLGSADGVIVFCELGRRVVPGPLVWTHLAAGLVDGAATGDTIVGGVDLCGADVTGSDPKDVLVEHLPGLDRLLVVKPDGLFLVDAKQLAGEAVETPTDPLTPIHVVASVPDGKQVGGPSDAARMRLEGAALLSGMQLGIAEATLELANAYAKEREQFGQPIGQFQAVKHMLADMFVRQEVARAAAYAAGATLDDPRVGDVERAVSTAKLVAGEAAVKNSRACIQVHGGMGFTWEVPAHYYLKRAWLLESIFGTGEEHAERMADCVERATHASL